MSAASGLEEVHTRPVAATRTRLSRSTRLFRRVITLVCALGCLLALPVAPAVAAAPEAPETLSPAKAITGNTALLEGVLNPHSSARVYWYFAYSYPNGSSCQEGPAVGWSEAQGEAVPVSAEATGLQPLRSYRFCLVAYNEQYEFTQGNEVAFQTPAVAPAVDSESVSGITPFQAFMEAQVNPENEETTYKLEYSSKQAGGELQEATVIALGGAPANVFGDQRVAPPYEAPVTGLSPSTRYYFRVIAKNATGETKGNLEEFETPAAEKPVVEGERFIAATSTSDTLEAFLNPKYQGVGCEVQFVTEAKFKASGFSEGVSVAGCNFLTGFGSGSEPVPFTATLENLEEGAAYEYRIVASNSTGTTETVPALLARTVPLVLETMPGPEVSEVTQHTAEIAPTLNPEIEAPIEATYYLSYGIEKAQGAASVHQNAGSGVSPQTVGPVLLSGLQPGTTYHYAVVVSNGNGVTIGPEHEFTTLPAETVTTPPAIGPEKAQYIDENGAVIEGEVNPQGQPTTYQVQYGTTGGYGAAAPAAPAQLGPFTSSHGVFTALAELAPGTTYHYRIVASNAAGTTYGADQTFTTTGAAQTTTFTPFGVLNTPQAPVATYSFPSEPSGAGSGTGHSKRLTRRQKLARALKACKRESAKAKRAKCEKQARKRYGSAKKVKPGGRKG